MTAFKSRSTVGDEAGLRPVVELFRSAMVVDHGEDDVAVVRCVMEAASVERSGNCNGLRRPSRAFLSTNMSEQKAVATVNRQLAAGSGTLLKLGIFSIALGVVPITSYFGSLHYVWEGNATYAAITAVVAANLVLISYIIASVLEDQTSATTSTGTGTRSTAVIAESRKER